MGHYHVVISYSVGRETYTGEFIDFGAQAEEYFHSGDTLEIRYNPKDPLKFYYPDLRTQTRFKLIWASVGAILAIFVMLIRFLSR